MRASSSAWRAEVLTASEKIRLAHRDLGLDALEARGLVGLPRRGLVGVREPRRLLASPDVPRSREVRRAAVIELEHGVRDRLEEPAVVRDQDDRRVERLQLALEPFEARDVQVVRRLVEEE
ncbi:MAG: hypothetical protein QOF50_1139 [Gaiellaceae bacterium]|nr:hypothetical protein [Gaiellaceae bacterium]